MPIDVIYNSSCKAPHNEWFVPLRLRRSLQPSGFEAFQIMYYDRMSGNLNMTEIGPDGFQGDFWSESGVVQNVGTGFTNIVPLTDVERIKGGFFTVPPIFLAYNKDDGRTTVFQPGLTNDRPVRVFPNGPSWRPGWSHIHLHLQAERTATGSLILGRFLLCYDGATGATQLIRFHIDALGNFMWEFLDTNPIPSGLQSLTYVNPRMGLSDPSSDLDLLGYPFIVTCQDGVVRMFEILFRQDGSTVIGLAPVLQSEAWGTGIVFQVEHWGGGFRDVISLGTHTILHKWILTTETSGVVKIDEISEDLQVPSMKTVFTKRWQAGWKFASLEDVLLRYRPADGYMDLNILRFS